MTYWVHLKLTRSQQRALVDLLVEHVVTHGEEQFVDVSTDTTTTTGDLINLVSRTDSYEMTA